MNIAIIIPSLGGGGAEKVAKGIGDYYSKKGDKVYYFLLDSHVRDVYKVDGEIINTGIEPMKTGFKGGIKEMLFNLLRASVRIRKLKYKYRITISISFMEECNYINILSRCRDKVIVRICTIVSLRKDLNRFLYDRRVISFFYSLPCEIVVMSRYGMKELEAYGIQRKKINIIPNAVRIDEKKKIKNIKRSNYRILTVGRIEPIKQQDRIIRSFAHTVKQIPNSELIIVGRGDNERYLKHIARDLGIDKKVIFAGFCNDVWSEYADADCFVMASRVEGFPNAMVEAMAQGIPIVATDSPGGIQDILGKEIDEHDGYIIAEYGIKTPEMPRCKCDVISSLTREEIVLGEAIAHVLSNEKTRERLSKSSIIRAKEYQESKIYHIWDRIII